MRFGEKCPCGCGYTENLNWRPLFMDIWVDVVETGDAPELVEKITSSGKVLQDEQFTYRVSKTRRYIQRIQTVEYEARGQSFRRQKGLGGKKSSFAKRVIASDFNKNLPLYRNQKTAQSKLTTHIHPD